MVKKNKKRKEKKSFGIILLTLFMGQLKTTKKKMK